MLGQHGRRVRDAARERDLAVPVLFQVDHREEAVTILGVDPGGTTGLCVLSVEADRCIVEWSGQFEQEEAGQWIETWIHLNRVDAVAIERYTIAGRTLTRSRQTAALELIGVTKFLGWKHDVLVELQSPADAKNVWTDKRLREHGLQVNGVHARDALRHAALLMQRRGTVFTH